MSTDTVTYLNAAGGRIGTVTTLESLFSDDFGDGAVNPNNWDVLDGGLVAGNVIHNTANGINLPASTSAVTIGSGFTGMSDSVSNSALAVTMGTTLGAERWYLSTQVFAGKEDILVVLSKTQAQLANSIFVGLVEVDPVTHVPLLNPNFAADSNGAMEFTNRGGCEFGKSVTLTAYQAEAIGDSSSLAAVGVVGQAVSWATTQECLIEIDSRDITVSTATVDAVTAKAIGASRVSTQCPNDKKMYKLLMRFRNVAAPALSNVVTIQRIIVVDNYEQRVQVSTGEGDSIGSKAMAVNIANTANVSTLMPSAPGLYLQAIRHKLISAASGNPNLVKSTLGVILGGSVGNTSASTRYLKFYNQATVPTVGTGTPVITIALPPNTTLSLSGLLAYLGERFTVGIAYTITGAAADADTTVIGANDIVLYIVYI